MTRIHIIHTEPRHLHRQAPPRDSLCKKNVGGFSRLISKTGKLFARKLGFHRGSAPPYRSQWSGCGGRNVMWLGPIDRRLMAAARCQSAVSGPLVHERLLGYLREPRQEACSSSP